MVAGGRLLKFRRRRRRKLSLFFRSNASGYVFITLSDFHLESNIYTIQRSFRVENSDEKPIFLMLHLMTYALENVPVQWGLIYQYVLVPL